MSIGVSGATLRAAGRIEADLGRSDPQGEAAWEAIYAQSARRHDLCGHGASLPARTPQGIRTKTSVLEPVIAMEESLVASFCRDLLGRAGT